MGKRRGLHTDHDYSTGYVRGLLCSGCNMLVGWFEKYDGRINAYLLRRTSHSLR